MLSSLGVQQVLNIRLAREDRLLMVLTLRLLNILALLLHKFIKLDVVETQIWGVKLFA